MARHCYHQYFEEKLVNIMLQLDWMNNPKHAAIARRSTWIQQNIWKRGYAQSQPHSILDVCWRIDFTIINEKIIPNISFSSLNPKGKAIRYSITFAKSFPNGPVTSLGGGLF